MSLTATDSATSEQLRGLWAYYRGYTHTAAHAAATAALTAFGLLVFVDPLFAVLAIAAYVFPPVVLYGIDADVGSASDPTPASTHRTEAETNADADSDTDGGYRDTDGDSDGSDTDSDGDDGDTDSDG